MMPDDDRTQPDSESYIDRLRREHVRASVEDDAAVSTATSVEPRRAAVPVSVAEGEHEGEEKGEGEREPEGEEEGEAGADPEPVFRMPLEARRALVSLMRQGVVLGARKGKVFEALVRHEHLIRAHLAELFLQLVLDTSAGVAFIRNRDVEATEAKDGDSAWDDDELDEGSEVATLIARRTVSLYDTLLLLILRKHYQERQTAGEQRIVIDIERVESAFVPFLPLTVSERSDRRQLNAALSRLVDKRLLSRVRGEDERFEITPVIRYVVDATFLESLLLEYERLAGGPDKLNGDREDDVIDSSSSMPLQQTPDASSIAVPRSGSGNEDLL